MNLKGFEKEFNRKEDGMKTKNGITLIALIITIIVLLILAGITISALFGDNGILNKASDSALQTELARNRRSSKFNI
jgi:type II secretory pathway pseudopilin PulG